MSGSRARKDTPAVSAQVIGRDRVSSIDQFEPGPIAKGAGKIGDDGATTVSNVIQPEAAERLFTMAGAIEPPYSLEALNNLYEHSNALRQNIDAYATNIDAFGHHFVPVVDFDADDADARIADSIYEKRLRDLEDPNIPRPSMPVRPTPDEVQAEKRRLTEEMRIEKRRLERFFDFACESMSFTTLRRRLRNDYELLGNAYIEVLRNGAGEIAEFTYIPGYTMRITQADVDLTPVETKRKISEFDYEKVTRERHLRKYVQVVEGRLAFFKDLGDPRIISKKSGIVFPSIEALKGADASDVPATEIMHFRVHSGRSAYGIPRWIGALLSVLGSRQAEEVNSLYFDNKGVPPLAILVSGGKLGQATVKRLESFVENEIKGRRNFHKILVLEAESQGQSLDSGGTTKIALEPLTAAQHNDALFQQYDVRNMDKIGMVFRLPRLLRGDVQDVNRATAEAALEFAEQQVFSPEREEFDFTINRRILSELNAKFWTFRSNAPVMRNPGDLSTAIALLVEKGVLTPGEGRDLCAGVFGKPLAEIDAAWTKQPLQVTLAGMVADDEQGQPWTGDDIPPGARRSAYGDLDGDGTDDTGKKDSASQIQLTRTALGDVVSVNEARRAHGLDVVKKPDGSADPDGDLPINEYRARRQGAPKLGVQPPAPRAKGRSRYTLADLTRGDGIPTGSRGARTESVESFAKKLLRLKNAIVAAQENEATKKFVLAKIDEMRAGDGFDPAFLRQVFPLSIGS